MKKKYLLVSHIPVKFDGEKYFSLDLWVKDLVANNKIIGGFSLLCPVQMEVDGYLGEIPPGIHVYSMDKDMENLEDLISSHDLIHVNSGMPKWKNRFNKKIIRFAKKNNKKTICCVSSDRAKTTLMNCEQGSIIKRIKAIITSKSIYREAQWLIENSDGVLLIGEGLKNKYSFGHKNIHIGTASWITEDDVISLSEFEKKKRKSTLQLCVATRLERMKGIHLAIEALSDPCLGQVTLHIYGQGEEFESLQKLAKDLEVTERVFFKGTVPYGEPFYKEIQQYDLMLLTNLNDEQPRLIFDALAQGLVPICPNSKPYLRLNVDVDALFSCGDASSLAKVVGQYQNYNHINKVYKKMRKLVIEHTIDEMHRKRLAWLESTIL